MTDGERYEIHCPKKYLSYEEKDEYRVFWAEDACGCGKANWGVLKQANGMDKSLDSIEARLKQAGAVCRIYSAPDSIPLEECQALLQRRGYVIEQQECWRLTQCLEPSPFFVQRKCQVRTVTSALDGNLAVLVKEYAGSDGLALANRQIKAGARAFFALNRAEIPVSCCFGMGYGSAFRLWGLYTAPNQRKKGYGAAALLAAVEFAAKPDRGYEDIFLYVQEEQALRLLEKAGFRGGKRKLWKAYLPAGKEKK
ncbi:GNAT family N-acetyltransferase [uncultured Ruthenibacterium sp.]|uniref:GNAT family N-acetyltransferase n=1 Tax=uncultured Ruthenibacterium sp. TaxID=1905347 RepID=UPI00349E8B41